MNSSSVPEFAIRPREGVGPLSFGMTVQEARRVLGPPDKTSRKAAFSEFPTDAYHGLGLHIDYGSDGTVSAVEFFPPGNPLLHGRSVIGSPLREVRAMLAELDSSVEPDECGMESRSLGIGVYAPSAACDPNDRVEGVIVFVEGYYDRS